MKRTAALSFLFFLVACSVFAQDFKTAIDRSGFDINSAKALMAKGQLLTIEEKADGSFAMVTAGIIVDASPEKVYQVLVEYEKYNEFMPSTASCKVVQDNGDTKDVAYKIDFKFSVLKWSVEYTLRQKFVENKEIRWTLLESKENKIKSTYGAWQLVPIDGGKTAAFYSTYSDLKSINWVIREAFKAEPSMELAVNASTCVMVLKALKNRVNNPAYAPNLKK